MKKSGFVKKIGLLGPYGGGNLGDAAIQQAMIENIRRHYPDAEIYGFSLNPEDTERRHGIPSFPIGRISWVDDPQHANRLAKKIAAWLGNQSNPRLQKLERWVLRVPVEFGLLSQAFKNLKGFQMLIASGGGQLDDYWGGPWSHPYTLLRWAILSKLRGTKYMFVSVGAGPLDAGLSRFFIRRALALAQYRSYRDEPSKKFMAKCGFRRDDPVYPDLAFSLKANGKPAELPNPALRPVVGIGPMSYFDPRNWPESDSEIYMGYLSKLATFAEWLIQKGCTIVFITGDIFPDREAIRDLCAILEQRGVEYAKGQIIENLIATVDDLLQSIALTDIVIASRFHGVLLSQLMIRPVLALSYHPKIDALMEESGQSEYCLSIDTFDVGLLKERFTALMENYPAAKAQVARHTTKNQMLLEQQYDHIFSEG
ncbi:MAG: polysaccharide pyruvyl transferase family protein [Anaerolineaceae bacterium]|nr:polysaccharide pyruvyl transferase family protein [Anaerolineaceae bacterium]